MTTTRADVRDDLVVDFDIYDPALTMPVDRMQERTAQLAEAGPVVWSSSYGGHWVVTGYEEVHQVLRDPGTFSSYPNNLVDAGQGKFLPIELDPPVHTSYRHVLQPLFNPSRMRALEPRIRALVVELIEGFQADGRVEFIERFAHPLPTQVFLALMGWPVEDAPLFTEATEIALNGRPGDTPEQAVQSRTEAAQSMFGYFMQVIARRRQQAGETDDVTTAIMHTRITDEEGVERDLTDEELARMFFLLLIAGLHTVQGSLAWMMLHLSEADEQRERILADPEAIPDAVEEILRYEAAVSMGRRATQDAELGGVTVREGDQLLLMLCAANRDESQFTCPADLKVDRTPNRHLSFGSGPHRCIGSHLARIELRIAMEELHRRIPDYRLDPADPAVVLPSQVRGFARLPLLFTPVAND
ncbi:cytochrome P450 [Kineosporia babensis]|uniref:Cytochrome P450 n=1 Tax=Kineosporia babensis TaxID=499548 RepID=A0A9X1NHE7_9ACTN|nr:cytochrome P450 [Kineosporia babensis]MCD5314010.1 cytochrome P450 [Kineosporia babensis]